MFSRKSHAWTEEQLSAYLDEQLAPLERAQLERHLRECADCRARLATLKWTVALLKQAPAPALPRTFVLPVPARRAPTFAFNAATLRFATALATLLLFAVVGVDLIMHFGAASLPAPTMAPAVMREAAAPTALAPTQVALAAPTSPALAKDAAPPAAPTKPALPPAAPPAEPTKPAALLTAVPRATSAPPTTQPLAREAPPTKPPAPAAAHAPLPTPTSAPRVANAVSETATAESAQKIFTAPTAAPKPDAVGSAAATVATPTDTVTVVAPTLVPPTASPSPTPVATARIEPTRAPTSLPPSAFDGRGAGGEIDARTIVSPLRAAEIGLFFLAVFFGALAILVGRR